MSSVEFPLLPVVEHPFAHVANEHFLDRALFEELRDTFPDCPPSSGPTGFSLYWQDDAYQQLMTKSEAWRSFIDAFHTQGFIDWGVRQFADAYARERCTIDLAKARFVPYHEDRIDKERTALRRVEHAPDELWVRVDIHQGRVGYGRDRHLDHARRVISMLIYMSDAGETKMSGGELRLHDARWKLWSQPVTVTPRENLMVAFPCSDRSWHSVPRITSLTRPRNYLQVHISSSVDVWPRSS